MSESYEIFEAGEAEIPELLPLMRGYCDFYGVEPARRRASRRWRSALIGGEGVVFAARREASRSPGFATSAIKWSMLRGARVAILDDLFVDPGARGHGIADRLIEACAGLGPGPRRRLPWNGRPPSTTSARRPSTTGVGAKPSRWLDYELELTDAPGRAIWKGKG